MPIRAVLFDHDGTLVDSEPIHLALWNTVLERHGVKLTEAQYRSRYAGVPTSANAVDLVARFGLAATPESLAREKNAATAQHLSRSAFPLMPQVKPTLEALAGLGLKLAVVTGAGADGVAATVRGHGLASLFSVTVSGDDVRRSKPAPDAYLLALARLGLEAHECIAVEDTEHGLQAAADAAIPCLALPTAMTRHHDFTRAAAVLDGLPAAAGYIRSALHA